MSQIDDFNESSNFNVDDFISETATQAPVTSMGSNQNKAAHAALLSPAGTDPVQVFDQSKQELDQTGESSTADSVVANAQGQNLMGYRRAAAELMTDPSATDDFRRAALEAINSPDSKIFSARAMVATQNAEKAIPNESKESADLRGAWASGVTSVLDYQREKQKFFNEMQLRADQSKAADYVSLAEDMVPMVAGYKQSSLVNDISNGTISKAWGTLLPGTATSVLKDQFNAIPYEERGRVMQHAMDVIGKDGSSILLPEEYDNANMRVFRQMTESGDYDATDETIDNVLGVLDVIGVGGMLAKVAGRTATVVKAVQGMSDVQRSWMRRFNVSNVQPTAPANTIKDANPELSRTFHEALESDAQGDIANSLYGAGREDAIAHNISPQVGAVDGAVESKTFHPERNSDFEFMPDADVLDFVDNQSGYSHLAPAEKKVLRSQVVNDFQNATGMTNRKEMTTVEARDDGVSFKAVYGPGDSGWSDIKDAVQQAKYSLKDYGIGEDQISFLVRRGDDYAPISDDAKTALMAANNPQLKGDWLLQINHDYKFNTADLERDGFEAFDVKYNIFDRWLPGGGKIGQGTLQSNLMDAQSMLHPDFTKGATISGIRGAQVEQKLMETVKPYVDSMKGLKTDRQNMVYAKIRQNNAEGKAFDYANLKAEGFDAKQVEALRQWKVSQDTVYELSNRDLIKSYQTRGFGLMEHPETREEMEVTE